MSEEGIPRAEGSGLFLVKPAAWNKVVDALARSQVVLDPTQFEMREQAGKKFYRLKAKADAAAGTPGGGGGGRFVPYIGGEGSTTLFLTEGCVAYCRMEQEDFGDSADKESELVVPVYPTLEGVGLDAEEPGGFDVSAKSNCSVWLVMDRTRCPFNTEVMTVEDSEEDEPDRVEIMNKGQRPEREKGKRKVLLFECDFETSDSGAKTITNLDQKWECDFPVYFSCLTEGSHLSSEDLPGSSDLDSSQEEDDPEPSSDSDSKDCPWQALAAWRGKQPCYQREQETFVLWRVAVSLSKLKSRCGSWKVFARFADGSPMPFNGQTSENGAVCVPVLGDATQLVFGAKFKVEKAPHCTATELEVWLEGTPEELDSSPDECCDRLPAKRFPNRWPHWCGYSCTTVVTPPP